MPTPEPVTEVLGVVEDETFASPPDIAPAGPTDGVAAAPSERVAEAVDQALRFASDLFDGDFAGAAAAVVIRATQLAGEVVRAVGEFVGGLLGGGSSAPTPAGENPAVPPAVPPAPGPIPTGGGSSPSGGPSWSTSGYSGGVFKNLHKEFALLTLFSVLLVQGGRVVRYSREPLARSRTPLLAVERPG